jgi:hypothetical protein
MPLALDCDYQTMLPHFTPILALALQGRLKARILEEKIADKGHPLWNSWLSEDWWAHETVMRMYRTQLKEAKAVISFSDEMLKFNRPKDAADLKMALRTASLGQTFRNARHRRTSEY